MIVLAIIVYLLLVIYEFIPLYKQNHWRDFWVNSVLGLFSFTIAIILSLGMKPPSPAGPIKEFIFSIIGK
ncbi:hypothetical protein [Bacillus sp. ISL-7]|uniref:hypothetical protein n=1 Tax=Bacillus sp. ISL-7 TaxID=2819136 RepID=UPI001BE526E4|nr:hypothetical protein [Bacillus sp. ISL-7]MBT2736391.1 hypothetical protein [Bacillus sp. ISL-7]